MNMKIEKKEKQKKNILDMSVQWSKIFWEDKTITRKKNVYVCLFVVIVCRFTIICYCCTLTHYGKANRQLFLSGIVVEVLW